MDEQAKDLSPDEIMAGFEPFADDGFEHSIEDFPSEIQKDVEGLLWLGFLEDEFTFCGHSFVIRTLRGDEELLASLVCKEYVETLGQARAWVWAQVAMALISVDGDESFCPPISHNKRDYARARFQYVTEKWFWPVAEQIHAHYIALVQRQAEALERVENLFSGSLPTFSPSVGSSIDSGDSEEPQEQDTPPQEDIREYLDTPDSTSSKSD